MTFSDLERLFRETSLWNNWVRNAANLQEEGFAKEIAQNEGIANLMASDSDDSNTDSALQ